MWHFLDLNLTLLPVAGPLEHCLKDVKVTENGPLDVDSLLELRLGVVDPLELGDVAGK